jgi:hypothetical protein
MRDLNAIQIKFESTAGPFGNVPHCVDQTIRIVAGGRHETPFSKANHLAVLRDRLGQLVFAAWES